MLSADRTVDLNQPLETVWTALQDLRHWEYLLRIDRFIQAFRPVLAANAGLGPGGLITLESGRQIRQTWTISDWAPPERFALSLVSAEPWPGPEHARLSFSASSAGEGHCRIDLRLELEFRRPWLAPVLNWMAAMVGREPGRTLDRIAGRLPRLFQE
jgi:hypothetical protein